MKPRFLRLGKRPVRRALISACSAAAIVAAYWIPAPAQPLQALPGPVQAPSEQQMLLEADQLVYDFDGETVTAVGNVQIYYGASVLDAGRVAYNQRTGVLVASGGVRMVEPSGNIITSDTMELTDDFRNAFVSTLNIVTTDRARFSALAAEQRDGDLLILRKGVYTACEPCLENPSKPPLWQIKSARIIHDRAARTIYYEGARLEFFGIPVAYTPFFSHPDPTVRRKSGFLRPSLLQSDAIGVGLTTPYFWNLAPNYDVTFSPTLLTKQGLLMQSEWRHRILNGAYNVRLAGIFQADKEVFRTPAGEPLSGYQDFRGSIRTVGAFAFNSRWSAGWDINATTDRTFNRDYLIAGSTGLDLTSTLYLTGLSERNFFDARAYHFLVQRENTFEASDADPATPGFIEHDDQAEQAVVHPVIDHNYILDNPVFGGEVRFDSNLASLTREETDQRTSVPFGPYYAGVAGTFTRATTRASWRRRFIGPGGQVITPFTYIQSDASWVDADDGDAGLASEALLGRTMPAGGVEYEWPFLAVLGSTVHTFGPRAQLIVRPDEGHVGDLPNEDAQSLVFDDSNLFQWDKFSGYDRQEGGTRANLALQYQGLLPYGASIDALVGQSYHLAGENPFEGRDHALTGLSSGLDTDQSDYIGRVTVNSGLGIAVTARGRFDEEDQRLNRGELNAIGAYGGSVASLGYAYIRESPAAGIYENREEVNGAASVDLAANWSALGSMVYDLALDSPVSRSLGLAYADECFEISAVFSETLDRYTDLVADREVYVRISLRTLAERTFTSSLPTGTETE